jgi:citrate lyase subunit beta/citryl-CoA lyase
MSVYTSLQIAAARSLLFVPGNRPDRFAKAAAARPDIVIIDLEDAVADHDKDAARTHAREWLSSGRSAMLRINGADTVWHSPDLDLVDKFGPPVMLPKTESSDQVCRVGGLRGGKVMVIPLVETAAGILAATELAGQECVKRLAFGSIDFAGQLGVDPDDRDALLFARSTLVTSSAATGRPGPIDGVTTRIGDPQAVIDDFEYARRLGMTAKLCIHPAQVDVVHAVSAPSAEEITWAERVVGTAEPAGSATAVDGRMVDKPVLDRARAILANRSRLRG